MSAQAFNQRAAATAADPTDPFIVAKAAQLGSDPNRIFQFVRDQVRFEVYHGSLRGARGTLWSNAGNSLDRASLLIALLRASGFQAQYVHGALPANLARQLIVAMFPAPFQAGGCPKPGDPLADPGADPNLNSDLSDHFWVEFGPSFSPADPSFPNSQIGQTFVAAQDRFTEVPDNFKHKVIVSVQAEFFNNLAGTVPFGGSPTTTEVLRVSFDSAELVGRLVSYANFTNIAQLSSPVISVTTNTYSPFLQVSNDSGDSNQDTVIRGQDFQEFFTNFPLGTNLLSGLFLNIDLVNSRGVHLPNQRALLDRVGFANRNDNRFVLTSAPLAGVPSIAEIDMVTINALPGLQDNTLLAAYNAQIPLLQARQAALVAKGQAIDFNNVTQTDTQTLADSARLVRDGLLWHSRTRLIRLAKISDAGTALGSERYGVRAYWDSPRLTLLSSRLISDAPGGPTVELALDLLKDDTRVVAAPFQVPQAAGLFRVWYGTSETAIESGARADLGSIAGVSAQAAGSVGDVFKAAVQQGVRILSIKPGDYLKLAQVTGSTDALARIGAALAAGREVATPERSVLVNGKQVLGWFETDPVTGQTIDVFENGRHQDAIEWNLLRKFIVGAIAGTPLGIFDGFIVGMLANFIFLGINSDSSQAARRAAKQTYADLWLNVAQGVLATVLGAVLPLLFETGTPEAAAFAAGFGAGFGFGFGLGCYFANNVYRQLLLDPADPPAIPMVIDFGPNPSPPPPGISPGVAISVVPDSLTTIPVGGAEWPYAYQAQIRNQGPVADTFQLSFSAPPGFSVRQSLSKITVPAGDTGRVSVCLAPSGTLPYPGQPGMVTATAVSTSNPAVSSNANASVAATQLQAIGLTASPRQLALAPGDTGTFTVALTALGNVTASGTISTFATPGISISGLQSSVTVSPGQPSIQTVNLTLASSASVGQSYDLILVSTTNPEQSALIVVRAVPSIAKSAATGANAAAQIGRTDIGSALSAISNAMTALNSNPADAVAKASLLSDLDSLIGMLGSSPFAANLAELNNVRTQVAAAGPLDIPGALTSLNSALSNLQTTLLSPAALPFDFELIPNSATSQPNLPATFKIGLFNKALVPVTYTLALSGVPAGVTGGLNTTTVTVPAGQSIPLGNANDAAVILTQPADLSTFSFNVTASANGVAGSTKTASGTLTARSQFLNVQQVVATPAFISPGGTTAVTASLANVVNQTRNVNVALTVLNSTNAVVLSPPPQSVTLSIVSLVTPVNFGTIATQSLPAGNYTLLVTVTDPATNQTLPGGIGSGALLIGSPVTATLAVNPQFVPTGNSLVTSTLTVNTSGASRANPLILLGSVATPSPAESLALNGNLAYLCDDNEVSVVNVSDPTHPILLNTAVSDSIKNDGIIHCAIQRGTLVVFADASNSTIGNSPSFVAFDLTNPTQPQLIKGTPVNKRFFDEPSYVGNFAFVPTVAITFFFGSQDDKFGDLVAVDISDFTNPVVVGTLEQPTVDAALGGHGNIWGGTLLNNTTMILGGSFSTGGGNSGPGRFQVADITNPANMHLLADLPVPGTVEVYTPLFQGNVAVAIADNAGWQGNFPSFRNGDPLVVVTFDITNPALPVILATVAPANLQLGLGGGQARIGDKLFLFGQVQDTTGQQLLLLVDITDPLNPALRTFPIGTPVTRMVASGNVLHTTSGAAGYAAYSIPGVGGGGQFTAQVQVPKGTGVNYDPASFNIAPSSITLGTGFDTLVWTNPANNVLTWNSNVLNSQPGQVRPVALSGVVNFTSSVGAGSVTLPQTSVLVQQILGLSPPSQTFPAGQPGLYTVTVKNPTSAPVAYNLSVAGIVPNWVSLASSVTVPAGGQVNVPLTIQTETTAAPANYTFIVNASTPGGTQGSVQGAFGLTGAGSPNPGLVGSTAALGVSLTLTPTQATAGQGTTATFAVQVANAGNVADTYTLSATVPPGVTAVFNHPSLTIQPGLSNAQQVGLSLTVAPGTPAASASIPVRAVSSTKNTVFDQKTATLNISGNGVRVALSPATALQGGTFQMTVTNLGNVSDTFDLSLGGPAAVIATLASPSVTLAPNASQTVSIAVGPAPFATLGSLPLVAIATSRANTAVTANASASVTIPATLGVTAVFNPQSQRLNALGSAVFPLNVQNTGTVEDAYSATIVSTSGPITASLVGLDGNPTQSIATFRLPGVSGGQLVLNATLTGSAADGVVTVKIQSLTNPAISATASAVLGLNKPFARAGRGQNVLKNAFTFLDGSQSFDGGGAKLTYKWTLVSQPGNSHISTSDIQGSTGPRPWVAPDKEGTFVFQLITNNGLKDSDPVTQTLNVFNNHVPPTANAGKPLNAKRGVVVTVDGSASANSPLNHPPKSNPLTYQWAFSQVPAGSHLTNASLTNATQAKAAFTPDVNGAYVLTLTVNDGENSSSDSVTVTVSDSNVPPNAVAGSDRRTLPNFVVNLDASGSNDPDNGPQPLSFKWNFVFGALNNAAIVNPTANKPNFTPSVTGFYVTRMVISDGASFSGDNVTVTVSNSCDANADGVVDGTDQDLMAAFIGQPALPNDPLDADHDGMITQNDIDLCAKSGKQGTTPAPDSAAGAGSVITAPGAATASGRAESGRIRTRISAVLNAASLRPGAVSPGEVVVITGSGFGPSAAFTFERGATGHAPVSLAGVEVRFDGRPAPVLQVAPDQISAVVPYAVGGQPWTSIEVVSGDGKSEAVRISVADAAPGLFTSPAPQSSDGDAAGLPAIATNEDGNANSDLTPAAAGSTITVFLTGAGETIPPGVEGALVETELRPRLPLRAFLDGQPVEIVGTAPAPGIVSSVIGLRVRIPAGLAPGPKRITIQVGNASSQPGVTVVVR